MVCVQICRYRLAVAGLNLSLSCVGFVRVWLCFVESA